MKLSIRPLPLSRLLRCTTGFCLTASVLLLCACGTTTKKNKLEPAVANALYCAHYLIYDMCAVDVNLDGNADGLYFDDTKEVFMYMQAQQQPLLERELTMHACAQVMDDELQAASSRLLYITDETSFFEKMGVQKDLLDNYARYSSDVRKCQAALEQQKEQQQKAQQQPEDLQEQANTVEDDPFGDPFDESSSESDFNIKF